MSERSELIPCWGEPERAPHRRVERSQYIYIYIIMVRPSPARRYIHCTATRDIFRWPHEGTSALSGTTCIIIAESAKQIALVSEPVSKKAKWLQTLIAILVMLPLYLESAKLFVNDLCPQCCNIA